jgi:hypothetical protein
MEPLADLSPHGLAIAVSAPYPALFRRERPNGSQGQELGGVHGLRSIYSQSSRAVELAGVLELGELRECLIGRAWQDEFGLLVTQLLDRDRHQPPEDGPSLTSGLPSPWQQRHSAAAPLLGGYGPRPAPPEGRLLH